jgi:hypothetical protein
MNVAFRVDASTAYASCCIETHKLASVRYPSEAEDGPNLCGWINIGAALLGHHFPTQLLASGKYDAPDFSDKRTFSLTFW